MNSPQFQNKMHLFQLNNSGTIFFWGNERITIKSNSDIGMIKVTKIFMNIRPVRSIKRDIFMECYL